MESDRFGPRFDRPPTEQHSPLLSYDLDSTAPAQRGTFGSASPFVTGRRRVGRTHEAKVGPTLEPLREALMVHHFWLNEVARALNPKADPSSTCIGKSPVMGKSCGTFWDRKTLYMYQRENGLSDSTVESLNRSVMSSSLGAVVQRSVSWQRQVAAVESAAPFSYPDVPNG
ncbi:hypothetical protein DVH05_022546 [Phytophthora capsici]|nr:hypothetical protein DVH05_022546 [Phytophthora capsici]